ncbi:late competence development ComFB family protein [bacterium]|nr:late competence development ComFB family protein [bacterium]
MKKDKYDSFGVNLASVRNIWEAKVIKCMNDVLPDYPEFDYCSICIQDVYALSMNQITPKYIQQGTVLLRKEYSDDDFRDIIEVAIEKVIKKPNHP